jgi:hypothetical protein
MSWFRNRYRRAGGRETTEEITLTHPSKTPDPLDPMRWLRLFPAGAPMLITEPTLFACGT